LVAGPIVRAYYLLPQFEQPKTPTATQIGWGFVMVVAGLFCKVVLADSALAPLVDALYNQPQNQHAFNAWLGVLSFSGQIYYDFAGYSLCAIGLALCFGFNFPDNFRSPYAARGFSDFWRRWHISLSSWLRDYLYIPFGGNRLGTIRTLVNLMLVMLIGGMWHGASWMFALWGGLHGIFLILERFLNTLKIPFMRKVISPTFIPELITFLLVTLAWIPFRATSTTQALTVSHNLTNRSADLILENQHIVAVLVIMMMLVVQFKFRHFSFDETFSKLPTFLQSFLILFFLLSLFLFSGGDQRAFIYFQF
jgi:alginate O-acetyltransferase complex protein AlgI